MNSVITLDQYINLVKTDDKWFVIPAYQRGYVWGKTSRGKTDSVTYLCQTLLDGYRNQSRLFLQGITLSEEKSADGRRTGNYIIIDGQQRTTFFYLLFLWMNDGKREFNLDYQVRTNSRDYLRRLRDIHSVREDKDDASQDIFFFNKTLRIIREIIGGDKELLKDQFRKYILSHVSFIQISLDMEKATSVFNMMNGKRATMKQEELIKADLLRRATKPEMTGDTAVATENTILRGLLAREWDWWLYWWNRDDVRRFYRRQSAAPLGWLLPVCEGSKQVSLDSFVRKCLPDEANGVKASKKVFKQLRVKQRRFEEAFDDVVSFNYMAFTLRLIDEDGRFRFLQTYFGELEKPAFDRDQWLKRYMDLTVIGLTHSEITGEAGQFEDAFTGKLNDFRKRLSDSYVYRNYWRDARNWLILRNLDLESKKNIRRKFDFSIMDSNQNSLEHVWPKSKVLHQEEGQWRDGNDKVLDPAVAVRVKQVSRQLLEESTGRRITVLEDEAHDYLYRSDMAAGVTEHSIGNLVLLYKNDNSRLSNRPFLEKKAILFGDSGDEDAIRSMHLLHTVGKFAKPSWSATDISENYKEEMTAFDEYFKHYEHDGKTEKNGYR